MKSLKRTIAIVLAIASLPFSAVCARGENISLAAERQTEYFFVKGKVDEISEYHGNPDQGLKFIGIDVGNGERVRFLVTPETYIADEDEIATGTEIIGFYLSRAPVLMIYPPQYNAAVIAPYREDRSIKVDLFDENLTSVDNMLKLNLSNETVIITQDGKAYDGSLANKRLAVFYTRSTRSIPAQTTPDKIVVLHDVTMFDEPSAPAMAEYEEIIIDSPDPYVDESGEEMVPLRAVAEALGLTVEWDQDLRQVTLSNGVVLWIDNEICTLNDMHATLILPPVLRGSLTYVPASFFEPVMGRMVYIKDGRVAIV